MFHMLFPESNAWTPQQRMRIAVTIVVAGVVVLLGGIYGYERYQRASQLKGVESIEELGYGFRRVVIAKSNKGEVGHYPFFYYRDRLLCQIGSPPSISPSGEFAVCQDARSGKLILFRRRDENVTDLTKTFIGIPSRFVWHEEGERSVEVVLPKEGLSQVFPLP